MDSRQQIKLIAENLAATYHGNPTQAAFIFDRIFLRKLANDIDLKPEMQFKIAEEDCGHIIGSTVREIHQLYLAADTAQQKQLKAYAEECVIKEFNKFNVNFLDHYTPNNQRAMLISFDAIVGRIHAAGASLSNISIKMIPRRRAVNNEPARFFAANSERSGEPVQVVVAKDNTATIKFPTNH